MFLKITLLITSSLLVIGECGLLRTPKVYNALITTDENLTPSRAYPVVQPVVHETAIGYPYNPFSPFGLYNSFGSYPNLFNPIQSQIQGRNGYFAARHPEPQPNFAPQPLEPQQLPDPLPEPKENDEHIQSTLIAEQNNSIAPKNPEAKPADPKSPIPLNEFGLPPSLLPLSPYRPNPQSLNLQSYPYPFPVIYDSFNGYNPTHSQYPVLPPYGYYPQLSQPNPYYNPQNANREQADSNTAQNNIDNQFNRNGREQQEPTEVEVKPDEPQPEEPTTPTIVLQQQQPTDNTSDAIKNHANKNKDIPDVPPPPIPSGAKSTQSNEQN